MGQVREKEKWELAAEELVARVRTLLKHRYEMEKVLRESFTADEARAQFDQLDFFARVLELELWRKGTAPDRDLIGWLAKGVKVALTTAGIAIATTIPGTIAALATTEAYKALTDVEEQADKVAKCVTGAEKPPTSAPSTTFASDGSRQQQRPPLAKRRRPTVASRRTQSTRTDIDLMETLATYNHLVQPGAATEKLHDTRPVGSAPPHDPSGAPLPPPTLATGRLGPSASRLDVSESPLHDASALPPDLSWAAEDGGVPLPPDLSWAAEDDELPLPPQLTSSLEETRAVLEAARALPRPNQASGPGPMFGYQPYQPPPRRGLVSPAHMRRRKRGRS